MALIVELKVIPSSGKSMCRLDSSDRLKCHLKSPPEKGKANAELVALIAKALKIPCNHVVVVSGHTSRSKRVKIEGDVSHEQLLRALGIERQMGLF